MQNQFDILHGERPPCVGALAYAAAGIAFIPWSPLARGLLTDRYLDPSRVRPGDRLYDEGTLDADACPPLLDKLQRLDRIARESGLTLSQLALACTLTLPGMGPMIPAASTVEQLESNAAAGRVVLSDEQRSRIERILSEMAGDES